MEDGYPNNGTIPDEFAKVVGGRADPKAQFAILTCAGDRKRLADVRDNAHCT